MFAVLRVITLPPDQAPDCERLLASLRGAAAGLPAVRSSWIAPTSREATINGGHIVWRMSFESERDSLGIELDPQWRTQIAPLLESTSVATVGYRVTRNAVRPARRGIWRALIFRVLPHGFPDHAAELERGLLLFPKYIPAIRSWALSSVASAQGPKAFTHVWEQEFDNLKGLTGDYMDHPIHWGLVDAWFDAEYPQYIVDPYLIQVVSEIDETILR